MEQRTYPGTFDTGVLGEDLYNAFPALKVLADQMNPQISFELGVAGQITVDMPDGTNWDEVDVVMAAYTPGRQTSGQIFTGRIEALAQGAVGVQLSALTQAQVRALMAILLYKAGGVDPATLTVKPLTSWV